MTPIRVRRLNSTGMTRMAEFLFACSAAPDRPVDLEAEVWPILTGTDTTSDFPKVVLADRDRRFPRRYDLAAYLYDLIPALGLADPTRDQGLWAWLALLWFDQLAPISGRARKIGERARWLPDTGRKYYRHLVLGPYLIYQTSSDRPERAMALLYNPPHTPGELVGQLAATQDVAQCRAAIGAVTALYYDAQLGKLKRGAGGKGAGSTRRFRTVLDQLDRTFDLHSSSDAGVLSLLPREFDRYRKRA
ncbi:MAG: hypothetical protein KF817_03655 [Phycisphaeraceae bacterium]|nr:hypothetical protein [Phycisphaeraceae bacterium]